MADFEYQLIINGELQSGVMKAKTLEEAREKLKASGQVVDLKLKETMKVQLLTDLGIEIGKRWKEQLSTSDKILFTEQLAAMLKAGLPMVEALEAFVDEQKKKGISRVVEAVLVEVRGGVKLSESLSKFKSNFSQSYLAVVKSGEEAGTLAEGLGYLSKQLKQEYELAKKLKSAMIYPAVVLTAMVVVMVFIVVSVLPKIVTFAEGSGQKLPALTLFLVAFSGFATAYWWIILLGLVGLGMGLVVFSKSPWGSRQVSKVVLRAPLVGKLIRRYNQARFARLLGGFYSYGVSVTGSFEILAQSFENHVYKEACWRIKERLESGQTLAQALMEEKRLFSPIMGRLVRGAEKVGQLGETLDRLAEFYKEELETELKNLTVMIEPILVIMLGLGVLGIVMAVVVPIYKVTSSLN